MPKVALFSQIDSIHIKALWPSFNTEGLKEGGLDSEISVRTAIKHIWRMGWAYNHLLCYQFDSIGFHLCKQRHIENILSAASKQV